MRVFLLLFSLTMVLFGSYEDGLKVFKEKCSSCHKEYISMSLVKDNFLAKNNTLLNMKAPSANMIVWAMFDSSKKIGDENDKEFQQIEIERFLRTYLENPDRYNSICDDHAIYYYETKESMKGKLSNEDYENLTSYFMEYKNHIKEDSTTKPKIANFNENEILKDAKKLNKKILVYATSNSCYFCIRMDKDVFKNKDIKDILSKHYIFIKVDVDNNSIPFDLQKVYNKITPSFFILNGDGKLQNHYPGAWKKDDFYNILNENR